jgi:cell division protein FtsN
MMLGAFAVGLVWLQADPGLQRSGSGLANTGIPRPTVSENQPPPVSTSLEFEFPHLLRTMEVMVPDDEEPQLRPPAPPEVERVRSAERTEPQTPAPAAPKEAAPPQRQPKPVKERREQEAYVLQIGSFRAAADAERLRARLALMGVETRVQRVTIDGKDAFHRVRSGPYKSQKELDAVRRMLTSKDIPSIVIKWKG